MPKLLLVARQAYLHEVRKKSFLIAALAPVGLVALVIVLVIVTMQAGGSSLPLGYVDPGGLLKPEVLPTLPKADKMTAFTAYADEDAARAALDAGEIQAYYVVPADFVAARTLKGYYLDKAPSDRVRGDLNRFLRASLLSNLDEGVRLRANEGITPILRSADGRRTTDMNNPIDLIMPYIASMLFVITVMMSAGYLLQAITAEKENRTVEMLVTSASPEQLVGGKALGLVGVSLTELLLWLVTIVLGVLIARPYVPELQIIKMPWELVGVVTLFFLPSFVLVSGVFITLGALMPDYRQGQQAAGMVNLFFVAPLLVSTLLFMNPNHPLLVAMTFFPTTAYAMVAMRWAFTTIPLWHLIVSWVLLALTALASIVLATRVFRVGMLHYGQPLSLASAVKAVRQQRAARKEASHA
ncbi:MAG: ABC transporter permease [Chloroflexi bacterium]|nr:ABC transporter permease [Chloroflexota bacterium]